MIEVDGEECIGLDPKQLLRATPRSFAFQVRGQSMIDAGIYDGDIVVGEFTPEVPLDAIIVAMIDGESVLKRVILRQGRPCLVSENPRCPDEVLLSDVVVQGVIHTIVRRIAVSDQQSAVS
jgi:SOS-response transcriptional repressor LexA